MADSTPATNLPHRKSLRNAAINYRSGWWSVTVQVAKNKSIFGAIIGEKAVCNALGLSVEAYWRSLPAKYPELELFDFVVMPNHFHALLRIHFKPTNREHHLGFLMSRFKGGTSFIYGKMRHAGEVADIGEKLWQRDYWDDLITSESEFKGWQKYIRENPQNWSSDRYGACTAYLLGDAELLNRPRIAFVASQGFSASTLKPRKICGRDWDRLKPTPPIAQAGAAASAGAAGTAVAGAAVAASAGAAVAGTAGAASLSEGAALAGAAVAASAGAGAASLSEGAALAAPHAPPVLISTFTSPQEREALRRALAGKRPLIAVFPAGIPNDLAGDLAAAIAAGWALAISPQPPGSHLNKKIATWCNEFLLRNADEIWVGDLSPNGMLTQMLKGLGHPTPPLR